MNQDRLGERTDRRRHRPSRSVINRTQFVFAATTTPLY
jgi:hypothetical protein